MSRILGSNVRSMMTIDSKDLYFKLSSKCKTVDKSICPNMNSMRFYLETSIAVFAWITCTINLASAGARMNGALTDMLALTFAAEILPVDLCSWQFSSSGR